MVTSVSIVRYSGFYVFKKAALSVTFLNNKKRVNLHQ